MGNIREFRSARRSLEDAIASLLERAQAYDGAGTARKTRELLAASREYARAFNRIEHMRGRK